MTNTNTATKQVTQMLRDTKADQDQFAVLDAIDRHNKAVCDHAEETLRDYPESVFGGDGAWNNFGGGDYQGDYSECDPSYDERDSQGNPI